MRKLGDTEPATGGAEEPSLIDNPDVPTVYADGILDIEIHAPNARITYFVWRQSANGNRVKQAVLVMYRPIDSCRDSVALFERRAAGAGPQPH